MKAIANWLRRLADWVDPPARVVVTQSAFVTARDGCEYPLADWQIRQLQSGGAKP